VAPEPEGSSPHSQQPANGPYPEPGESTPHPPPPPYPISIRFSLILSCHLRFGLAGGAKICKTFYERELYSANMLTLVRFKIFMVMTIRMMFFWVKSLCVLFAEASFSERLSVSIIRAEMMTSAQKMETTGFSKNLAYINQSTW
jgi:hypothetical protein